MKNKDKTIVIMQEQEDWLKVEDMAQNTVVQVFAQVVKFNWFEPYKVVEEFEQRATGFLINNHGDILTNAHVVDEAKQIWIQIPSLGRHAIHVEIVGLCPEQDVALLRMHEDDRAFIIKELGSIPFLRFGDSDVVRRTDKVLALGYALGQQHLKSTTGIISGREFIEDATLLQITAPVNPGNSGGPLLNRAGEVIGITNSAVLEASNVGYAMPINDLKVMLDELYANKLVRKNAIGVRFNISTDECAQYFGNPVPSGAYINRVAQGSLAQRHGIAEGDMLYSINGFVVDAYAEVAVPWSEDKVAVHDVIDRCRTSDPVELVIYRSGVRRVIAIKLESMPLYPIRIKYPAFERVDYEIFAGMIIMELTDNHLEAFLSAGNLQLAYYDQPEHKAEPVVIITHVLPGSFVGQLRSLSDGDILKEINGMPVTTLPEVRKAFALSLTNDFVTIKTAQDVFVVLPFTKVLDEEARLSQDYGYPVSQTVINIREIKKHGT